MPCSKRYIVSLSLILLATQLPAQNITGTWEGNMGNHQFLQLNIIQNGDKLCGYTWDYIKGDSTDHCKAYFEGQYYKKDREWLLNGTSFIENAGSHYLMRIRFRNRVLAGDNILEGESMASSFFTISSTRDPFGHDPYDSTDITIPDSIYLKKVADQPQEVLKRMADCFTKKKRARDTMVIPPVMAKPAAPVVKAVPPPVTATDSSAIPQQVTKRKNIVQGHLDVQVKNITLNVYDNAIVDDDTVSIFYNGKLLLDHQRLSGKPIVINLELDEKQTRQEIILFAENLGSIPPNTALIVVYAGDKRYELYSSASLQENAVLVFDYRPR